MSKKIQFNYNGVDYTLEYNRRAIEYIEKQGFQINELSTKPMLMLPLAFEGLFFKNHKKVTKTIIDEIFDKFTDKENLISTIAEMLTETYNTLQSDPEDDEGNIEWKIV